MPAIIGTAGHIDHGKTALVRALTGQDTDRLKEEKERGISIDLGFAYFERPDGTRAGVVDVPGHERFIRNMLAGAHGMDVVLLVVAADDGVMPQTEEHLEIIHLLGVERGIAVITKSDLVSPARVEEVKTEIAALLEETALARAPLVVVSSATGQGVDELKAEIERQLVKQSARAVGAAFRMPVDRAFVMHGHGVVITGTATSGTLREGAAVRLLPGGEECRVRSLEVHGTRVTSAAAGQRVAINLGGVEKTAVGRGHTLVEPRYQRTTKRLDAAIEIRPSAGRPLRSHALVRLHLGTAAVVARVHLLDGSGEVCPGARAYAQFALAEDVAAVLGDRFVLRDETAQRTLGGGVVLQPLAERHRGDDGAARALADIEGSDGLGARLLALARGTGKRAVPLDWILQVAPWAADDVLAALRESSQIVLLPQAEAPESVSPAEQVAAVEAAVCAHVADFHRASPLVPGPEMESVRTQVAPDLAPKLFRAVVARLEGRAALVRDDSVLRLPSHEVTLAGPELALAAHAEALLTKASLAPPDLRQMEAELRIPPTRLVEILAQLEREKRVVRIAPGLYFAAAALEQARDLLAEHLRQHGEITAAVYRDLIRGSRKFSIALLDYFDRTGFTLRVGDLRKLRRG